MDLSIVIVVLVLLLLITLRMLVIATGKKNKSLGKVESLDKKVSGLETEMEYLSTLKKYSHIDDVDSEILERQQAIQRREDHSKTQCDNALAAAKDEAKNIAGSAYEIKEQADKYTSITKAMKNIIEGYGNEYLVPNVSVLDELAADFEHKEAGANLKIAREKTKVMVFEGHAAKCDYAEAKRKDAAIKFVIDAFNGKVDSILTKIKHDNYGTLSQQIKDSSLIVNTNGTAFKSARITGAYLKSRLSELRWAVSTMELKAIEKEEQRAVKEQMREEEKARREFEKAIKESEKEEKMLQKAMVIARKALDQADASNRIELEEKMTGLLAQLAEAESKNIRALSMAQQTRRGHVYVISNVGSFGEGVYKIGMTRRLEPLDRVKELGDASVPFEFDVHAIIGCADAPKLEKALHHKFHDSRVNKVNNRKEFFRVNQSDIKDMIQSMEDIKNTHWTLKSEAREYRETVALEQLT